MGQLYGDMVFPDFILAGFIRFPVLLMQTTFAAWGILAPMVSP